MRKASTKSGVAAKESKPLEEPVEQGKEEAVVKAPAAGAANAQPEPQEGPTERDQEEVVATMRNGWGVRP